MKWVMDPQVGRLPCSFTRFTPVLASYLIFMKELALKTKFELSVLILVLVPHINAIQNSAPG
jgi:hypothetical protein